MKGKNVNRPFPEEIVLSRVGKGEDEFYTVSESREDAAFEAAEQPEERIAVYQLVQVLLPKAETTFIEAQNEQLKGKK